MVLQHGALEIDPARPLTGLAVRDALQIGAELGADAPEHLLAVGQRHAADQMHAIGGGSPDATPRPGDAAPSLAHHPPPIIPRRDRALVPPPPAPPSHCPPPPARSASSG